MRGLDGRRILVTGAGGGIGGAVSARLVEEGARVVVADLTVPGSPDGVVTRLAVDITSEHGAMAMMSSAVGALGGVDGIVLCAGNHWAGPTHEMPIDEFDRIMSVHVRGTFLSCKHAIPSMIERGGGTIVTLGSTAAVRGAPMLTAYATAKGAIVQLTRSIALEYAASGIRANCVCPGPTDTTLLRRLLDDMALHGDVGREFVDSLPLRRFAGPQEIAATIAFLLSDESTYTTGATVMVDGGYSA